MPRFERASRRHAPRPLSGHRLLACSTSAPATARRLSPRAAWRSLRDTRGSRWRWTLRASSRPGSAPRPTARAWSSLAQLIADELGVAPATIRIIHGDTDRTPYGWGTFASRSMVISGGACKLAAAAAARRSSPALAGHLLEAAADDIVLADGRARVRGTDRDRDRDAGARTPITRATASAATTTRPDGQRDLRSGRHLLQCLPCRDRRGRSRDRRSRDRALPRGRGCRPPDQPDDRRRPDPAAASRRASPTRCTRRSSTTTAGNILTGSLADYLPPTCAEIPPIEIHHMETYTTPSSPGQGAGRGRRDRRAGGGDQCHFRCAGAVRRRRLRNACHAERIRALLRGGPEGAHDTRKVDMRPYRQRRAPRDRGRAAHDPGRRDPRGLRADRHPSRLRARRVRRLHGPGRRRAGALLPDVRGAGGGRGDPHGRGPGRTATSCIRCSRRSGTITACNAASARRVSDAGVGVLEARSRHRDEELRDVLSSNLCRCTGYQNIIKAVRAAADQMRREADRPIGQAARGPAAAHRTGRFAADITFPDSCTCGSCARQSRSAACASIDIGAALARAGRGRGLDRRGCRRHSADRLPHDPCRRARALSPAGAGARLRALCRRAGRRCSPTIHISPRTPPIWCRSRSRSCRRCSTPRAAR